MKLLNCTKNQQYYTDTITIGSSNNFIINIQCDKKTGHEMDDIAVCHQRRCNLYCIVAIKY